MGYQTCMYLSLADCLPDTIRAVSHAEYSIGMQATVIIQPVYTSSLNLWQRMRYTGGRPSLGMLDQDHLGLLNQHVMASNFAT